RMQAHEGGQEARQPDGADATHRAEDELPAVEVGELLHFFLRGFDFLEDAPGALEEHAAGLGQGEVAAAPFEQPDAELLFEQLDLLGQGGLTHVELVGGATKTADAGDARQIVQLAQLHGVLSNLANLALGVTFTFSVALTLTLTLTRALTLPLPLALARRGM